MKMNSLYKVMCLFAGISVGVLLNFTYQQKKYPPKVSYIVKDTIVNMKVDKLREGVVLGNTEDYKYLKQYFQQKGYPEEILYYSMLMAESHHYFACKDVCNSLKTVFKKYNLGEFDKDTQKLYLHYLEKKDSILIK